jgi:cytoskeleton protein RodZ
MESIGEKLKTTRESRGFSLEQVARDTNIARRYIGALESEDFSAFPGEPYLIGFLRNYAEYLGMDSEELVGLYRNMQLQEQPVPMEELLNQKAEIPPFLFILLGLLILAAGAVYVIGFTDIVRFPSRDALAQPGDSGDSGEPESAGEEFSFPEGEEVFERRFPEGSRIVVSLDGVDLLLAVRSVDEKVLLDSPAGELSFSLDEQRLADLDGDDEEDLRISVFDILTEDKSAVIRLDRFLKRPSAAEGEGQERTDATPALGSSTIENRRSEPETIQSADSPEPFVLDLRFRGYALFRYLSDGSLREERYFREGERFRIDVDREIRLWISNAGAVSADLNGKDISLGSDGEVATKLVTWERGETGDWELLLIPVY